jgi:hypothetical protein
MAKAVHMILTPAARGTSAGWLRWQNTTNAALVGGFTRYPVGFNYAQLVEFLYRTKTFSITATAVGSLTTVPPPSPAQTDSFSTTYSNTYFNGIGTAFDPETEFVNYAKTGVLHRAGTTEAASTVTTGTPTMTGNLVVNYFWHEQTGAANTLIAGYIFSGLYYPQMFTVIGSDSSYPPNSNPSPSEAHNGFGWLLGPGFLPGVGQTFGGGADGPNQVGPFTANVFGATGDFYITSADTLSITSASLTISQLTSYAYT